MKKKEFVCVSILTLFLAVLLLNVSFAIADDLISSGNSINDSMGLNLSAGVTPDSGLYGLKLGWEKMKLMFILNSEKKAQRELDLAKLRLVEAKVMAEKGNEKAAEIALLQHDKLISKVEKRITDFKEGNTEQNIRDRVKDLAVMERSIQVHSERIESLRNILAEENLSSEKRDLIEQRLSSIENVTEHLKEISGEKRDRIEKRLMNVTGRSENETRKEIEDIENLNGLNSTRKMLAEIRIANTEKAIEKLEEREDKLNESGMNVSFFETTIQTAKDLLTQAKTEYDTGNYSGVLYILKPVDNFGRQLSPIVKEIAEARLEKNQEKVAELIKHAEEKQLEHIKDMNQKLEESRKKISAKIENRIENSPDAVAKKFSERVKKLEARNISGATSETSENNSV